MATSGRVQSGSFNGGRGRFYFQWQLAGQNVGGNYSTINWQWGLNISGGGYWLSNAIKSISGYINGGQAFGGATWSNLSGNGDHQLLAGSWNIGHDNNGYKDFGISSTGWAYGDGNFSNSGSWNLPTIPRNASITGHSGNINDESAPYISYHNPAGGGITAWLELPNLTGSTRYAQRNGYGNGANFNLSTGERDAIRATMANVKATTVRYVIYTNNTGAYDWRDATISIVNANPVFTTVGYHDSNSTMVTMTGDDQYIVQGQSVINVDILSGDKAVALKGSSMVSYTATINAVSTNFTYSGSTINQALNTGSAGASTDQVLSITATDSRGNTTTVQKTVIMVPYTAPVITTSAVREDGFGEDTEIAVTGTFSPIVVGMVEKNSVNNTNGVGYKVWAVGGTEPGSYTNIASTTSGSNISTPTDPIETLDSSTEYNLKVQITDEIQTVTANYIIPIGLAAFRIGTDGFIYNQGERVYSAVDMYPVGTVLITSVNTNPSGYLPGSWSSTTTASQSLFGMTLYGWRRTA